MKNEILIANNMIEVKESAHGKPVSTTLLGTLIANFVGYGYALSEKALKTVSTYNKEELKEFWNSVKPALDELTGKNRNMEKFVVYKNFPEEVLKKSEAEYWIAQILMYLGVANEYFTEEVKEREPILEDVQLKVLHVVPENFISKVWDSYVSNKSRWSDNQTKYAEWILNNGVVTSVDLEDFGFKENGISAVNQAIKLEIPVKVSNATDVLRLAAAWSESDASLRSKVSFKNFSKHERRVLLSALEGSKNLEEDMAMRKNLWKKLLSRLHPGDFKFERVKVAYDQLYKGELKSFNSKVETLLNGVHKHIIEQQSNIDSLDKNRTYSLNELQQKVQVKTVRNESVLVKAPDVEVLSVLQSRPGEMLRRFHKLYKNFGSPAVVSLISVLPKLTTIQLLKFSKYVETVNSRKKLMFAPKGNWTKAQLVDNDKVKLSSKDEGMLLSSIAQELSVRANAVFENGVSLDVKTKNIKLQTNDQELAEYGRGTVFDIPENITFLRSASFWSTPDSHGNVWYDNGWNFFDESWNALGTCCWDRTSFGKKAAIFSGDPTNSKDMEGRACQMIDLYIDELAKSGVRYAVWNILAFSRQSFNQAKDVLGTLQMGEVAVEGNLYEPSRAQMVFSLKGDNFTKYIAYVDVKERKLVYMDANLYGDVSSAAHNESVLAEKMPAFTEYLDSLPSVYDFVSHAKAGSTPVLYSDKDAEIKEGSAYVFRKENEANEFIDLNINSLLD